MILITLPDEQTLPSGDLREEAVKKLLSGP